MKKIIIVGDIYIETQYFTDTIPQENEFAFASETITTIGSKTINVARTLTKLGNEVSYAGVAGNDESEITDKFKSYGINSLLTKKSSKQTGKIAVITPKSGKSSIILSAGANQLLTPKIIRSLETKLTEFDSVYTSTALPLESLYILVDICRKHSVPIFLDIPNQQKALDLQKVSTVDFFMPNRQEAILLIGKPINTLDDAKVATETLRKTIKGTIIITLDRDGCVVLDAQAAEPQHYPVQSVTAIDETGAGDIFRGAFVSHWLETQDLNTSVRYALELATKSVLIKGVNTTIETIKK